MSSRRTSVYLFGALIGLCAAGIAAVVCHPHARAGLVGQALWRAELVTYDFRMAYSPPLPESPDITLVTLDEVSFSQPKLAVWPWPRRYHAWVLDRLKRAGAKVIALDMILEGAGGPPAVPGAGPDATGIPPPSVDDLKLTKAIRNAGNVVLAVEVATEGVAGKESAAQLTVAHYPYPDFEDAALALACVDLHKDLDEVVRQFQTKVTHQSEVIPTVALQLAGLYRGQDPATLGEKMLTLGRGGHPALGAQSFLVNYRASVGVGFKRIPYYQVLEGSFDPDAVRGKIVLVGGTALALQDIHGTPVSMRGLAGAGGQAALMPGVEILAHATDTVLRAAPMKPVSMAASAAATILCALAMALLLSWLRPLKAFALGWLPLVAGSTFVTFELFWNQRLWVPLVPILLGITLAYAGGTVYLELTVEREQARIRRAWAKRVSPEVLSVILNNPGLAKVTGRQLVGTVFFSDLQGFTTFCHSSPPEVVVEQINRYLELATRTIRKHGGTIHKFIGDGVMAVFGDPVPHSDHAARAVAASVELQKGMAELRRNQLPSEWPMIMRIGLHTGELIAGDIGSEDMLEYTVMGDTVSTASRLEGMNKEFGTGLLLSQATAEQLGDAFGLEALGNVQVRGRSESLEVYTVREVPKNG